MFSSFILLAILPTIRGLSSTGNVNVNVNEISQQPGISKNTPKQLSKCPPRAVMVKRNKQSMSFFNGSPLVFPGAIAYSYEKSVTDEDDSLDVTALPLGALVAVSVSSTESRGSDAKSKGNGPKRNKRGGKKGGGAPVDVTYPHFILSPSNNAEDDGPDPSEIAKSQLIGYGVYNPNSMYRVRMLCHQRCDPTTFKNVQRALREGLDDLAGRGGAEEAAMRIISTDNLRRAFQTRRALGLPSTETDSYRLVNGEGDGLSGLAVDVLGGKVAVVMSSAAWCERHRDLLLQVIKLVADEYYPDGLEPVWRNTPSRLKQDGYHASPDEAAEDVTDTDRAVIATESGVKYQTFPWAGGQKTGFYCDQRENRSLVASLCKDKRVLDLCCFNGGFALNAARSGAALCLGVDSSRDAVDAATENAVLNGLEGRTDFVKEEISDFMKNAALRGDRYDVIVLDPPKLAPSVSGLERASRKYQSLNRDAMKLIDEEKGGLLLTCSCSAAMTQKDGGQFFVQMVNSAAISAGRRATLLGINGAASCHVQCGASFPLESYLTAGLFAIGPLSK